MKIMLLPNEKHINSQMDFPSGQQPAYGFIAYDANAVRNRLLNNNVKVGEMFDYDGYSFSFYDIDGNKIEVWEIKKFLWRIYYERTGTQIRLQPQPEALAHFHGERRRPPD